MRPLLGLPGLILCLYAAPQSAVRVEIISLPAYHSPADDLYLAGSFNNWNAKDTHYRFQPAGNGHYYFDLRLADGKYEYKITRGSWERTECKKGGGVAANRVLVMPSDTSVRLRIEEWADHFQASQKWSTAGKNVSVTDTAFFIPQLKKKRRVWVYLPEGYASSGKRYPVLYMHDGQNVFDEATSYSGEWGVDECLDSMKKKCIVVAVDNGGTERINEYSPYDMERFGKGQGDLYVKFLAKTLKPFVDKKYRTLRDSKHTFVAGSSMGGLISIYAVLKYPKVFGGAGVFSPSFWISGDKIYYYMKKRGKKVKGRIYFYAGKQESDSMVPDMLRAFSRMAKLSKAKMTVVVRDEGKHNEARWRMEFPLFYEWMVDDEK